MKLYFTLAALSFGTLLFAQDSTALQNKAETTDTVIDTRPHNSYGDLLSDDPAYNKRAPIISPAISVLGNDVMSWAIARYVFRFEWAHISVDQWKKNLSAKWEWDNDRFGINFIGHPHSGSTYFNIARSSGYSFWSSIPFAIEGSFIWEYFGENTAPSRNDLINTPVSGAFLGEIFYRLSSNVLDDRKRGGERVFRELLAAVIDPSRAFSRLTSGKMFRVTRIKVYQQEPLNITLSGGLHKVNDNNKFGSGSTNAILNLQFDYGDPFEVRRRKPFDVFRFRLESRYGDDKKLIDNVIGYGLLFGKNISRGDHHNILIGGFQHFDYWNNKIFEMGSLGFGPGIIARINTRKSVQIYSSLHFTGVPLAGYGTRSAPDTSEFRDYPFGGGMEAKIQERLNAGRLSAGINGYYYWIWNYDGSPGRTRIGIIKPFVSFRIFNNVSLGFEHHVYYDRRYVAKEPFFKSNRTEQKFYLEFFFEDKDRKGRYH